MNYLLSATNTYRVPTVSDALALRKEIELGPGEISSFTYTTKYIREKGEIVDEYQQVKVKILFNDEKEPENSMIDAIYGNPEDFNSKEEF